MTYRSHVRRVAQLLCLSESIEVLSACSIEVQFVLRFSLGRSRRAMPQLFCLVSLQYRGLVRRKSAVQRFSLGGSRRAMPQLLCLSPSACATYALKSTLFVTCAAALRLPVEEPVFRIWFE